MYFEKSCKINNNGKVSGYHKTGKYEDGKITYFINDNYGDDEQLKAFEHLPSNPIERIKFNPFLPSSNLLETYLNPRYFNVRPKKNHRLMNDSELIDYCSNHTEERKFIKTHKQIKRAIKEQIHSQLEEHGFVDKDLLDDFKFSAEHVNEVDSDNPFYSSRWDELKQKYLPPQTSIKAKRLNIAKTNTASNANKLDDVD